jgi:hypothetical protein
LARDRIGKLPDELMGESAHLFYYNGFGSEVLYEDGFSRFTFGFLRGHLIIEFVSLIKDNGQHGCCPYRKNLIL